MNRERCPRAAWLSVAALGISLGVAAPAQGSLRLQGRSPHQVTKSWLHKISQGVTGKLQPATKKLRGLPAKMQTVPNQVGNKVRSYLKGLPVRGTPSEHQVLSPEKSVAFHKIVGAQRTPAGRARLEKLLKSLPKAELAQFIRLLKQHKYKVGLVSVALVALIVGSEHSHLLQMVNGHEFLNLNGHEIITPDNEGMIQRVSAEVVTPSGVEPSTGSGGLESSNSNVAQGSGSSTTNHDVVTSSSSGSSSGSSNSIAPQAEMTQAQKDIITPANQSLDELKKGVDSAGSEISKGLNVAAKETVKTVVTANYTDLAHQTDQALKEISKATDQGMVTGGEVLKKIGEARNFVMDWPKNLLP